MARGGKREGAGRPKGSKTRKNAEIAQRAAEQGITPLEYMLEVMRDEANETSARLDAAKSAAPYIHPRLSAVQVEGGDKPLKMQIGWLTQ